MFRKRSCLFTLLVVFAVGGASQAGIQKWESVVEAAGPLHWYRFNEAVGTTVANDEGSAGLDGAYRSLVDLGQEGLFGAGQAVQFEAGGQQDVMYTQGGNVTGNEWTAEFIVMKNTNTAAQALCDSSSYSLRLIGYGVNEEVGFTEYGVIDAQFTAVGGADLVPPVGQWLHIVYRRSGSQTQVFVDGVLVGTSTTLVGCPIDSFGGRAASDSDGMDGLMDEAVIYDYALTDAEIAAHAAAPFGTDVGAILVQPKDGAVETPQDTILIWSAGTYAQTHDVYLGTTFDEVAAADRSDSSGILVSQGQTDTTYDSAGALEYGQTYYWRIDEVNAAPDNTIFKGDVWSFTVELFAYPIANITATASDSQTDMGPENTINGSGLDADDQHGTDSQTMWVTSGDMPVWVQYEFDKVYKLHELWVWNSNQMLESFLGFGAKSVTIEYSTDGQTWSTLEGTPDFNRATGTPTYTANTIVDMAGVTAKFVKLTINTNWGGIVTQTGLSEVRFFYVPVQAFDPSPAAEATDVSVDAELNWRPGRDATSHTVYLGTDSNAVAEGLVSGVELDSHSYAPVSLDYATTYFWKVDETGDAGTYAGDVWSFTTEKYAAVEDFESYNDDDNRIYETWIDGLTDDASGSQVGYNESPFAETTIVHGGAQSMPLMYDNTSFTFSQATRTFDSTQDWTARGVKSLSLFFQGVAGNTGTLYLKINNTKVSYDGPASDIAEAQWLPWNVDLSAVGANLAKVASLTIGVEGSGASGTVYIDDIRLYPRTPEYIVPAQPDDADLVAMWTFDGDFRDSVGSHHGTAGGNAAVVSDAVRGQVLSVDGTGDKVDIAYSADLNPEAFTVSFWANPSSAGSSYRSPLTSRDDSPQRGYIFYVVPENTWQFWTGTGSGWDGAAGPAAQLDEWSHVTGAFANDVKSLYVNGRLVAQSTAGISLNTQQPLRIGGGATESDGNYFFMGMIDEVRLYDRALSVEEVAGLAGQTTPLPKAF